jgi:hypothetical protein
MGKLCNCFLLWSTLSDGWMGLSFTRRIATGLCQSNQSRVQVLQNSDHILLSHLRLLQPEGQVTVFISPRNRVAHLYPRALGFFFVASYNSRGYDGYILICLHAGNWSQSQSHITTLGQSVGTSWCRAHCGTCNQIVLILLFSLLLGWLNSSQQPPFAVPLQNISQNTTHSSQNHLIIYSSLQMYSIFINSWN